MNSETRSAIDTGQKYRVQVLDRAIDLLEALANNGPERGLGDLAACVSLHKSTVQRLLSVLERRRLVERAVSGVDYCLGMGLFELGMKAVARLSFETARPILNRLASETGETAHLGVLRDRYVVSLVIAEGHHELRTPSTVGRRAPAHCTSQGKAILAFGPDSAVARVATGRLTEFTPKTITTAAELKRELKKIRVLGYAVDDEEFEAGLRCIGAPVRDHTGAVVAAISIAGPVFRVSRQKVAGLAAQVTATANNISRALGCAPGSSQPVSKRRHQNDDPNSGSPVAAAAPIRKSRLPKLSVYSPSCSAGSIGAGRNCSGGVANGSAKSTPARCPTFFRRRNR